MGELASCAAMPCRKPPCGRQLARCRGRACVPRETCRPQDRLLRAVSRSDEWARQARVGACLHAISLRSDDAVTHHLAAATTFAGRCDALAVTNEPIANTQVSTAATKKDLSRKVSVFMAMLREVGRLGPGPRCPRRCIRRANPADSPQTAPRCRLRRTTPHDHPCPRTKPLSVRRCPNALISPQTMPRLSRHSTSWVKRAVGAHPRGEFRTRERP
ncbi:hypothetical protein ABIE56_002545 [Luteibacter sp. 621]